MDEVGPAAQPALPVLEYAPPPVRRRGGWILALLTAGSAVAARMMYHRGAASAFEAVSFVTGAVCVWLTVRESAWNFPIGLVNVTAFAVVFFRARLLGDAGL